MAKAESNEEMLGLYEVSAYAEIVGVTKSELHKYGVLHAQYLKALRDRKPITKDLEVARGSLNDYIQATKGVSDEDIVIYERLHKEAEAAKSASVILSEEQEKALGTLDEYLENHGKSLKYKDKVLIAEISGDIGAWNIEDDFDWEGAYLDEADLSGSRLVHVRFNQQNLLKVNLRDCFFDEVTFSRCNLSHCDLRGVKLRNCKFLDYKQGLDEDGMLSGLKLSCADSSTLQSLGVFSIVDEDILAIYRMRIEEKYERECKKAIKEKKQAYKADSEKDRSWGSWALKQTGARLFYTSQYDKNQQIALVNIEESLKKEYAAKAEKEVNANLDYYKIRVQDIEHDPTYVYRSTAEIAELPKYSIKVTRDDVLAYQEAADGEKELTFKAFVKKKYAAQIAQMKDGDRAIIIVPDLSKENISGLDLSNLNFNGCNLSYCNLSNSKFNGSSFCGAAIEGSLVTCAEFIDAKMVDCNMLAIKGEQANFKKAIMLRARMEASQLEKGIFDGACMYSADISYSTMAKSSMVKANLDGCIADRVNLSYVDTRHASFRKAKLTDAILVGTDFTSANLEAAIMDRANAEGAIFEQVMMDHVQAQYANFREAVMSGVRARHGNFTAADMTKLKEAFFADFSGSVMDRLKAKEANFTEAVLNDVKAKGADFTRAVLDKIQAERFDILDGVMEQVSAYKANLSEALMHKVKAFNADFTSANLRKIDAIGAEFTKAILVDANLEAANLREASLREANLQKAKCKEMQIDDKTMLVGADFVGARGLDKAKLEQRELQEKLYGPTLGHSKYGICLNNRDGSNDRFKLQQIGARTLIAAMAVAGCTLSGPLSAIGTTAVGACLSEVMLDWAKDKELGFINNEVIGDRLAELGVIAHGAGIDSLKGAVFANVAASIATSAGLIQGGALLTGGLLATVGGVAMAADGYKKGNNIKTTLGSGVVVAGMAASAIGASAAGGALTTIGYATAGGSITGAIFGAKKVIRELGLKDENGNFVKRPEDIYRENSKNLSKFAQLMMPSFKKVVVAIAVGIALAAVACACAKLILPALAMGALFMTIASTAATAGFVAGYFAQGALSKLNERAAKSDLSAHAEERVTQVTRAKREVKEIDKTITTPVVEQISADLSRITRELRTGQVQLEGNAELVDIKKPPKAKITERVIEDSGLSEQSLKKSHVGKLDEESRSNGQGRSRTKERTLEKGLPDHASGG